MSQPATGHSSQRPPYDVGHTHSDVSGGWLRAASFGAMDGLVSNTALIAGVAAGGSAHTVMVSGIAGLLAGAFSMALGESEVAAGFGGDCVADLQGSGYRRENV